MYFMFNRACGHSIPIIILGFFNAILTYSILVVVVVVVGWLVVVVVVVVLCCRFCGRTEGPAQSTEYHVRNAR